MRFDSACYFLEFLMGAVTGVMVERQPMKFVQVTEDLKESKETAEPASASLVPMKKKAAMSEPAIGDSVKKIAQMTERWQAVGSH